MNISNVSNARKNIYKLINKVVRENTEILITGKRGNAVLISESDWNSIKETLYMYQTGNAKDVIEGMSTPLEDCEEIDWRNTD